LTGRELVLNGIIDTGFSEFVTLSPSTIIELELPYQDTSRVLLGDGRVQALHVYETTLVWGDQERVVLVHATDGGVPYWHGPALWARPAYPGRGRRQRSYRAATLTP